jgi:hypothetical protein
MTKQSILIRRPILEVFDYLMDVDRYWQWAPYCVSTRKREPTPNVPTVAIGRDDKHQLRGNERTKEVRPPAPSPLSPLALEFPKLSPTSPT